MNSWEWVTPTIAGLALLLGVVNWLRLVRMDREAHEGLTIINYGEGCYGLKNAGKGSVRLAEIDLNSVSSFALDQPLAFSIPPGRTHRFQALHANDPGQELESVRVSWVQGYSGFTVPKNLERYVVVEEASRGER